MCLLPLLGLARTSLLQEKYVSVRIGESVCNVTQYGAKGDGAKLDTAAIQRALDTCNGTIFIPRPGRYLIQNLSFTADNTALHIEEGATLLVSDDITSWPNNSHVISAYGRSDIAITGGGTVDGQGFKWWRAMEQPGAHNLFRPHMVDFSHVSNAILSDTLYLNAPNHVLELGSDNTELTRIKVLTPPSPIAHNTDAVDVHGSPFYVHHVNFTTGDDNIAGHANNTLVEDSYFGTGHGASIGSLCGSYLTNITFRRIVFENTTAGARVKSHPNCSGHVWNILYEDLTMKDVDSSITINQFYFAKPGDPASTYLFENFTFRNITSDHAGGSKTAAVDFNCDTAYDGHANCRNFRLVDVHHTNLDGKKGVPGMECKGVTGIATDVTGLTSCLKM